MICKDSLQNFFLDFLLVFFFLMYGRNTLSSKETGWAQGDWREFCCMFVCYIKTTENKHLMPNIFKVVLNVYLFKQICMYLLCYSGLFGGRNATIQCFSNLPPYSVFLNLWQVFPCLGSTGLSHESLFCPRCIAAKGRAVLPTVGFWIRP